MDGKNRKKILLIDDEVDILSQIKKRLEASHFNCLAVREPVDGMKLAISEQPSLILLDLMMPQMSGLGFLRQAKGNPRISKIPVIVLTALGDEEVAHEAMALGASAFFTKDCSPEELLSIVRRFAA